MRAIALAVALSFSLGHAHAFVENAHDGGQGQDKERRGTSVDLSSLGGGNSRDPAEAAPSDAAERQTLEALATPAEAETLEGTEDADVAVTQEPAVAEPRTRIVTRTRTSQGVIRSVTRSITYTQDEDGRTVLSKAVARVRAPDDAASVENGAGRIVAKTSVDVADAGAAFADAGGTIGIRDGKVEVSTFGKTSAEVH